MFARILCFLVITSSSLVESQFVIRRSEDDVFRNLTGCMQDPDNFCYSLHAESSPLDQCVCRCFPKYPMYRNPDVSLSGGGKFVSKGKPACVWHSNHRYECFHIRKLGRGFGTSDDEGALEFDFSNPGSLLAFSDHDLSKCTGLDTAIKMPEETEFTPKTALLTVTFGRFDVLTFEWTKIAERYDGGILRGVFQNCPRNVDEAGRCFVGKIIGVYNGGNCNVRASNGECCIFPFTYKGEVYNNCTTVDSDQPWCAVDLPFYGNETNWRANCTDPSKIIPSSSSIMQGSSTSNISQPLTSSEALSETQTVVLQTTSVSLEHSSVQLKATVDLKSSSEGMKVVIGPTMVAPVTPVLWLKNASSSMSSAALPDHKAAKSHTITVPVLILIVMATVAVLVISLLFLLFLLLRHRKNRNKNYGLINKKAGSQAMQSPASSRPDTDVPSQSDVVTVEGSEGEVGETEFTIPEKNDSEASDKRGKQANNNPPAYMTFKL